jgi:hypothetical protein
LLGDILAIITLIILALILIWGALHLFSLVRGWISSSIGGQKQETGITVTAPKEVRSGETFSVSWKNNSGQQGDYAFVYQCKSGLAFKTAFATGTQQQIPCGVAYRLPQAEGAVLRLTPSLTSAASTTVPFSILLATGTSTPTVLAQAGSAVTVLPGAVSYETDTYAASGQTGTYDATQNSPPDLAVSIVGVGYIDPVTDQFIVGAPTSPAALSAVQFDIVNRGSGSSGVWSFGAKLPTETRYPYRSPEQAPLGPGDHVLNTLRFSGTALNGGEFSVTASSPRDLNTRNDTARVFVPGNAYPAYSYPQYQQPGYQYQPQYEYIYQ